ncbi:type 4 prepilin-like proteins leader peptide-processing enzyme [Priestia taiwanensis]|uniref:Type 4 prepilin-like proteins leader peptide-processing enzyme n=1 Tax=Priestia taiwanensis TaxID=1347902 RepID=A0A917AUS0_9BACI|nr:type 4 prepilin-like proteins leader peptide-processing enzyme [Priestia taiwanensis]
MSYMWQRGKCANCRTKISSLYPCMELLTGLLFVVSFLLFGFQGETAIAILLVSLFMIITVSDLAYMLIPNRVLVFFFCLFVVGRFIVPPTLWYDSLLGMAVGFGLLYVIAVVSRGGMGGGDIKLYAVLGYVLGWKVVLLSFFLSTLAGAIGGSVGLLIGRVKRGETMPFGPYIMVGTLIAYFFYTPIINWYMNLVNL